MHIKLSLTGAQFYIKTMHLYQNSGMEEESSELPGTDGLAPKQRHQAKHRELFLSRHVETLPATHIRGKCSVTLLNETESLLSYLNKDDAFFYCLVFDPSQKTLLADKGEIRVGSRYQTEVTNLLKEGEEDPRKSEDLETLVWTPSHGLTDRQIDQFLVVSRSVGTFARALDCSSSVKQPSLHMSAAAASRDITLRDRDRSNVGQGARRGHSTVRVAPPAPLHRAQLLQEIEVTSGKAREEDTALSVSHRPHRCTVLNCSKVKILHYFLYGIRATVSMKYVQLFQ
ncbi:BAH domain-containing protein [Phthorimaea operculella]|nr:BAH domain-containing protein [Phthorimaea operculella]